MLCVGGSCQVWCASHYLHTFQVGQPARGLWIQSPEVHNKSSQDDFLWSAHTDVTWNN